jgi:hypothetical protein
METYRVVPAFEVLENGCSGLSTRGEVRPADAFAFERVEEGLHGRIVRTVGRTTHAGFNAQGGQQFLIAPAGVLASPVGMVQQARLRMPTGQGHLQGESHQMLILGGSHGPAYHHAREQIQDDGKARSIPQPSGSR